MFWYKKQKILRFMPVKNNEIDLNWAKFSPNNVFLAYFDFLEFYENSILLTYWKTKALIPFLLQFTNS